MPPPLGQGHASGKQLKQIVFAGERFDVMSVRRWRDRMRAAMRSEYDIEERIVCAYLLTPLLGFGLIERQRPSEWPGINDEDAIRVTSLFRRFIRFPKSWSPWLAD